MPILNSSPDIAASMTKKKLQIELECNPDKEKGRAPMS
jgi:hypothetical protein